MVSWLVHSSPDWVVQVRALARDNMLCSWIGHLTLTVPLTNRHIWVLAILMLGVTLWWTSIPSRVELKHSYNASCHWKKDKLWPEGPLGLYAKFAYLYYFIYEWLSESVCSLRETNFYRKCASSKVRLHYGTCCMFTYTAFRSPTRVYYNASKLQVVRCKSNYEINTNTWPSLLLYGHILTLTCWLWRRVSKSFHLLSSWPCHCYKISRNKLIYKQTA